MQRMFGTNGVRGLVGQSMTPELALRLGHAVGTWLPKGARIAIATDARRSGDMLKAAFAAGAHASGVDTVDLGVLPSPAVQLYVRDKLFDLGVIVTASHNPSEWNGIKLIAPDGTETSREQEDQVEALYRDGPLRTAAWDEVGCASVDTAAARHYLDAIQAQVDGEAIRAAGLKVVLDPGGGAGCVTAPTLLEELGVEGVLLSCELDGAFTDRPSEPTPDNAARAMAAVIEHGADLGILQDGDADRAVFIDEKGHYVWGDQSLALAALHELARHPKGSLVCTAVSSSTCVKDAVERAGGKLLWTVVGSPIVAREMIHNGAVFGGEDNGGLMFTRHQVCRDGLMALAFILELLATTQRPLSDLVAEIPRYALVKDKLHVPDDRKESLLAAFREAVEAEKDIEEVDGRDGVKAYLPNGWVLVRPSGTEPLFRVQAEAASEADAQAIATRFRGLLESIL